MEEKTICAQWYVELKCECPHCNEWVDLLESPDFFDIHRIEIPEHGTSRTTDMEADCPECGEEFLTDLVW